MLVFESETPEYPEQDREPTTNSIHRVWESSPGHNGGRRALSPLRHTCSPKHVFCEENRFPSILWKLKVKHTIWCYSINRHFCVGFSRHIFTFRRDNREGQRQSDEICSEKCLFKEKRENERGVDQSRSDAGPSLQLQWRSFALVKPTCHKLCQGFLGICSQMNLGKKDKFWSILRPCMADCHRCIKSYIGCKPVKCIEQKSKIGFTTWIMCDCGETSVSYSRMKISLK